MAEKSYTWEELQALEHSRRKLLSYGARYKILFQHYSGTILQYILWDPLFWCTIAVFFGVRMFDTYKNSDNTFFEAENVIPNSSSITVIGAFLSFILTMFVNQILDDFQSAYHTSMKAKGKISEMATLGGTVLPKERADRLVRHLNAAHLVGYTGLSNTYTRENFFDKLNEEMQVLTEKEMGFLDKLNKDWNSGCCWEIVTWAMVEIEEAAQAGDIDRRTAGSLSTIVFDFRQAMSSLFNSADQPSVNFFYFHLVTFLCTIYLPLFAMYEAYQANQVSDKFTLSDVVGGLVVFVQCCYVIGMRLITIKLMSPYGSHPENLSVITFVRTGWETSNGILKRKNENDQPLNSRLSFQKPESTKTKAYTVLQSGIVTVPVEP